MRTRSFALLLVIAVFRFFLNFCINEGVGRVAVMLAPSMSFAYVLHGHSHFYHLDPGGLGSIESFMIEVLQLPQFLRLSHPVLRFNPSRGQRNC